MIKFDLTGRAGVITGAGKGIGEAVALELAGLGAQLVVCARTQADIDRLVDKITAAGGQAVGLVGDVRHFDEMERLAKTCADTYGKVDFTVPNAGTDIEGNMLDADPADWQRMIDTNVLGTAFIIRATLPYMKAQNDGHIVIMASISGRVTYLGEPMYIASKWAIAGMGGALRKEALEYNVRVTLIEPGLVDTPMIHSLPEGKHDLEKIEALSPEHIAWAVAFALCQPPIVNTTQIQILPLQQGYSS
jgi:NADP-dependent 3-hydroxy acid dehydrogenase YdfG